MKEEFLNKIKNNEYISNRLYQSVKDEYQNFNIEEYNSEVLDSLKEKYKDYFQNMFKGIDDNIVLDDEQIKAILSDEDSALIIAGAGTGKTTTMTAKVKYLVDIKKVEPSKILVMSYTKKATQELEKRIRGRRSEPEEIIQERLGKAKSEMSLATNYEYSVLNDNVVDASERIKKIIKNRIK